MYYLWLKQRGYGCDYTIGCGQVLEPLNGVTPEDGEKFTNRIKNKIKAYGDYIEEAIIVQKVGTAKKIIQEIEKEDAKQKVDNEKAKKMEQYKKLQKELNL